MCLYTYCADDETLPQGRNPEFIDETLLGLMHKQTHKDRLVYSVIIYSSVYKVPAV